MGKIYFNWNLKNLTFDLCDLNIDRNFLQAPDCECGCGGKMNVVLRDQDEIVTFCGQMCYDNDCEQCAVFAVTDENKLIAAIKLGGEIEAIQSRVPLKDYKEIGKLAVGFDLHCYGLIVQSSHDSYRIVEK